MLFSDVLQYKKEKEDAGLCVERPSPGAKPDLLLRLKHEMKKISVTNKQAKQVCLENKWVSFVIDQQSLIWYVLPESFGV